MMKPGYFDPFNDRLARDIRNNLSVSFLKALAEKDVSFFQRCGADYMQQNPAPDYAGYITTRLAKYEEAYAIILQRNLKEVLLQASVFWDLGLYYEMHELLEPVWKEAEGDKRMALQGLIRAAGMKVHAENNNMAAAKKMGAKALAALVQYAGALAGDVKLDAILAAIRQTLDAPPGTITTDQH